MRPVATGTEEAEFAGAVDDLGDGVVLRSLFQPPGDEPEVGADDQ